MDGSPLRVEGFGRRYRRNRPWAVRDLSLAVPEGSITALVGPNGAGKSMLIRACLGFERPDEGRILVYGHDPQRNRTEAVNAIGYVSQQASLALCQGLPSGCLLTACGGARSTLDR